MDHAQSTGQEMPETRITSPEHAQTVVEALWDLYLSNKHCDITIVADHHEYHVHKAVIVCTSDYFANLLEQEGDDTDKFVIPDVPPSAMEVLLEYMYTGSLCLNRSSIWSVLSGAMLFNLDTLVKSCSEYIALTADDAKKPPDKPINVSWTTLSNLKQEPLEEPPQHTVPPKHHKRGRKPKKPLKTEPTIQESATVKQKPKKIKSVYNGPKRPRGRPRKEPSSTVQIKTVKRKYVKRKKVEKKVKPVVKIRSARRKVSPMMCPVVGCDQLCNGKLRLALHKRKHSLFWRLKQVKPVEQTLALSSAFCVMMKYCEIDTSGDAKYVCLLCEKQFQYTAQYKIHFTRFHFKQRHCQSNFHLHKYPCKFFPHWWRYRKHVFRFHGDHEIQNPRPIPCKYCRRVFLYPGNVDSHMQSQHSDVMEKSQENKHVPRRKRLLPCLQSPHCKALFDAKKKLEVHMEKAHPECRLQCPNCNYSSAIRSNLERHMMKHVCKFNCTMCGMKFKKISRMKVHMFTKHRIESPGLKIVKCPMEDCRYRSVTQAAIDKHLARHNADRPFTCDKCEKSFKKQLYLDKHLKKIHMNIRPYICEQCGMAYGEIAELKSHLARHSNIKAFTCSECSYSTHDKGNLKSHLFSQHKIKMNEDMKIFTCNMCDYITDVKYRFTDHMRVHLNLRDLPCPHCSKMFMTRKALNGHIHKVHDPKNLHCSHCDYACSNVSKLREHTRIVHTHKHFKPYQCSYCNFTSASSGNCRKHIMGRHRGMDVKYIKLTEKLPQPEVDTTKKNPSKPWLSATKTSQPVSTTATQIQPVYSQNESPPPSHAHIQQAPPTQSPPPANHKIDTHPPTSETISRLSIPPSMFLPMDHGIFPPQNTSASTFLPPATIGVSQVVHSGDAHSVFRPPQGITMEVDQQNNAQNLAPPNVPIQAHTSNYYSFVPFHS